MRSISYDALVPILHSVHLTALSSFLNFYTSNEQLDFIVLFGSVTKGYLLKSSDIDLAVVSNRFETLSWSDRIKSLKQYNVSVNCLCPIGLTHKELTTYEYPSLIRTVREQGLVLINYR